MAVAKKKKPARRRSDECHPPGAIEIVFNDIDSLLLPLGDSSNSESRRTANCAVHILKQLRADLAKKKRRPHEWYVLNALTLHKYLMLAQLHHGNYDALVKAGLAAITRSKKGGKARATISDDQLPAVKAALRQRLTAVGGRKVMAARNVANEIYTGQITGIKHGTVIKADTLVRKRYW